MKNYLQKLGQSIMLPVSILPIASILIGIGHWVDPRVMTGEQAMPIAAFLVEAGNVVLWALPVLFAVGIATGLAKDNHGSAGLSGMVAYFMMTRLLNPATLTKFTHIAVEKIDPSFLKVENVFFGIIAGIIAGELYNRYHKTKLPVALAFFNGKRLVPILSAGVAIIFTGIFYLIWPVAYNALVAFGTAISGLGAFGAGLYGFFNKLLIPTGLHHALNSVFWFDVIGINDIGNFWAGTGKLGVTGMYQAGYFPIMMFGLPAAGLAIYKNAKPEKKEMVKSMMIAGAFASFFTGITEPIEFAFMFAAPFLYFIHAILTGISMMVASLLHTTAGFTFSAGLVDYLLSYNLPMASKPILLMLMGLVFAAIYYFLFDFIIRKMNLMTPGREEVVETSESVPNKVSTTEDVKIQDKYEHLATEIYDSLGGQDNIEDIYNCISRLRLVLKDTDLVDEARIKALGVPGVVKVDKTHYQVIIGTDVQSVADEMKKLHN